MGKHKVNDSQFGEMEWDEGVKAYKSSIKWSNDKTVTLYLYCKRDCFHCVLEANRIIYDYLRKNEKEVMEKMANDILEWLQVDSEDSDDPYVIHETSALIEGMELEYVELDYADISRLIYGVELKDGSITYVKAEVSLMPFYSGCDMDCIP